MRFTRPSLTRKALGVGVTVLALTAAGGVAIAVSDSGEVYTACKLNKTGTIRLIDTSLPSTNLLGKCTAYETQIQWNERGATGAAGTKGDTGGQGATGDTGTKGDTGATGPTGAQGPSGPKGADGDSVSTGQLDPGSPECPVGGSRFTVGERFAYACNGEKGDPGQPGAAGSDATMSFYRVHSKNMSQRYAEATCNIGDVAVGGGGEGYNANTAVALRQSDPSVASSRTWVVQIMLPFPPTDPYWTEANAICAHVE